MSKKPYKTPRIDGLFNKSSVEIKTWGFIGGNFTAVGKMEIDKIAAPPFAHSHAIKISYIDAGEPRAWLVFTFQNDIEVSKNRIRQKWRSLRDKRLTPTAASIESPAGGILWEHK